MTVIRDDPYEKNQRIMYNTANVFARLYRNERIKAPGLLVVFANGKLCDRGVFSVQGGNYDYKRI